MANSADKLSTGNEVCIQGNPLQLPCGSFCYLIHLQFVYIYYICPPLSSALFTQVKEYMEMLQEEDPTKYEAHFAKYLEAGIEPDKMEDHTHQLQRCVHLFLSKSLSKVTIGWQ